MNEPAPKAAHPHNAARHPQPQRVSPAEALVWLKAGWGYFIGNPGVWIAISVIFIVMLFVLGLVPLLGWAVVLIGFPVMVAGMVLGCHAQANGVSPLRVDHLFAGLKVHAGNLALVGVFYLLGGLIAGFVSVIIGGGAALTGYIIEALAGLWAWGWSAVWCWAVWCSRCCGCCSSRPCGSLRRWWCCATPRPWTR
jgi:hypothetical protein